MFFFGGAVLHSQARVYSGRGHAALPAHAVDTKIVEVCRDLGVPPIPGGLTPSELEAAWRSGAPLVKLFPGRLVGPQYVRDVLAPLSDLRLIVTGGIDAENALEFLGAGAVAVGVAASRARAVYEAVRLGA